MDVRPYESKEKNSKCQTLMPKRKQNRKINENIECLILKSWLIFNERKKSIHSFVNCKFLICETAQRNGVAHYG